MKRRDLLNKIKEVSFRDPNLQEIVINEILSNEGDKDNIDQYLN